MEGDKRITTPPTKQYSSIQRHVTNKVWVSEKLCYAKTRYNRGTYTKGEKDDKQREDVTSELSDFMKVTHKAIYYSFVVFSTF
jgi:hypothetical protein